MACRRREKGKVPVSRAGKGPAGWDGIASERVQPPTRHAFRRYRRIVIAAPLHSYYIHCS